MSERILSHIDLPFTVAGIPANSRRRWSLVADVACWLRSMAPGSNTRVECYIEYVDSVQHQRVTVDVASAAYMHNALLSGRVYLSGVGACKRARLVVRSSCQSEHLLDLESNCRIEAEKREHSRRVHPLAA